MPAIWHQNFWCRVNPSNIKEVKITGGEPFLYKDLGTVVGIIQKNLGPKIPIKIFTGGRNIISLKQGKKGIGETVFKIMQTGIIVKNVEIHLSVDEHHSGSLYRASHKIRKRPVFINDIQKMNKLGIPLLQTQVKNFLDACEILTKNSNGFFKGGKLKLHVGANRLKYHRKKIFYWVDNKTWKSKVICSEGLIKSGAAKKLKRTIKILPNSYLSLFIIPGAEFYKTPQTHMAQTYFNPENKKQIFLDLAREDGNGASILGWWNIINKNFCGGSTNDALNIINNLHKNINYES